MIISFEGRITFLPPLNEVFKMFKCYFGSDLPLVGRADLFKFLYGLLLIPGLDFIRDIPFQMNGTELQIRFWESICQGIFNAG